MDSHCNICGNNGAFIPRDNDREGLICTNCSSTSRLRAIVYLLGAHLGMNDQPLAAWEKRKSVRILESSGRGPYPIMFKERFDYYNTEYNPNTDLINKPFTEYADFQHLAYQDETFDIVIASDVFEHVREDEKGFREIYRVLKRGGIFILTVPYHHEWEQTLVRVKIEGDKEIHLLPPEYHGGGGQTLAYRTYGRDLLSRLRSFGYSVAYIDLEVPAFRIGRQPVFICSRSDFSDMTGFHTPANEVGAKWVKASPLFLFRIFVTLKYNAVSVKHFFSEIMRRLKDAF
jgi:SAM-dependent methyltransferase